ncbi:MAG: hypothetical protein NXI18_12690 [Alphaproteobacteria bacterium]|nr:hypothetical protein [Alphaproteobacteria bacterium]
MTATVFGQEVPRIRTIGRAAGKVTGTVGGVLELDMSTDGEP